MPNVLSKVQRLPGASGPDHVFHCPGCGYSHGFNTEVWTWNGDMKKPTVSPSLLCRGEFVCHSFITDGMIKFLSDCTHHLAGQTVKLEAF